MERLGRRLSEAAAALARLDELAGKNERSLVERDSAVLRLIFTYEAVWKACQKLLATLENISAASPNATIRAARNLGWLSDEDAQAAIKLGEERNLAVHMYRDKVGEQIESHLGAHAALLHRWLDALSQRLAETGEFGTTRTYRLFEQAIIEKKQIVCMYDGYRRELCPIILGHSQGEEKSLTYQFGGESRSGLPRDGEWRCLFLSNVSDVQLRSGRWHTGDNHTRPSRCVEIVDLDVDPHSPYDPKRPLSVPDDRAGTTGRRSTTSKKGRRRSPRRSPAPKRRK
ncbi:MAG: nucleotidyltransferase substrate binding protein [Alphaproteobacteria bacterium]|nr:nucleotidyltransferase substrate binding protein [Alphaproteobacteria bacterium]